MYGDEVVQQEVTLGGQRTSRPVATGSHLTLRAQDSQDALHVCRTEHWRNLCCRILRFIPTAKWGWGCRHPLPSNPQAAHLCDVRKSTECDSAIWHCVESANPPFGKERNKWLCHHMCSWSKFENQLKMVRIHILPFLSSSGSWSLRRVKFKASKCEKKKWEWDQNRLSWHLISVNH